MSAQPSTLVLETFIGARCTNRCYAHMRLGLASLIFVITLTENIFPSKILKRKKGRSHKATSPGTKRKRYLDILQITAQGILMKNHQGLPDRTKCKVAKINNDGKLCDCLVIYPQTCKYAINYKYPYISTE